MSIAYQQALNQYDDLLQSYDNKVDSIKASYQLDKLNKQVKQQTSETLAPSLGLPMSYSVAKSALKTASGKALLSKLGKKIGLQDEDVAELQEGTSEGAINVLDRVTGRAVNRVLGRTQPQEATDPIADEPFDTEAFNVEFPQFGHVQQTDRFGNLIESHFVQREPLDADEFFDAEEDLDGDLMETSFPSISSDLVTMPHVEGTPMTNVSITGNVAENVGADVAENVGEDVAENVGEDVATEAGLETGLETTGAILDATPLAPLGLILGLGGAVLSFLPFFHHHHHHKPPPPPKPNLTIPTFQAGA